MVSVLVSVSAVALFWCQGRCTPDDDGVSSNPFDKFFPDLTTVQQDVDFVYKMYQFKNHPTLMTMPPPPRGPDRNVTTTTTQSAPVEDQEGDFLIVPVEKPPTNGNPFLTKDGMKKRKVNH